MARTASSDPLEKFRFLVHVSFNGQAIGTATQTPTVTGNTTGTFTQLGFHDIQLPKRTTNKVMYREGQNPDIHSLSAGLSTMEDIVMSRGLLAYSAGTKDFYNWISLIHAPTTGINDYTTAAGATASKAQGAIDYRGEVTIQMLDRGGNVARQWKLYNAFPTHFVPGSDLNASEDGEKSIESLTLAYEDFQEVAPSTTTPLVLPPK